MPNLDEPSCIYIESVIVLTPRTQVSFIVRDYREGLFVKTHIFVADYITIKDTNRITPKDALNTLGMYNVRRRPILGPSITLNYDVLRNTLQKIISDKGFYYNNVFCSVNHVEVVTDTVKINGDTYDLIY